MKIGIQTWGSNGDIRPFIALADGLKQAGHTVTLVVSSVDNRNYAQTCTDLGIVYQQVPEYMDFDMQAFAKKTANMNTIQWLMALLNESFLPHEAQMYQAAQDLAADNDVLIGHHFLYPLKIAAKKQHKPHISVTLCQMVIANYHYPPFRFPNLGTTLNRGQWWLINWLYDFLLKKPLSQLWFAEGLPPFKHAFDTLLNSDTLNLVAVEPLFCEGSEQWQAINQICGFLNLPDYAEDWSMSSALQNFLDAGDAPIYMTLGSVQQAVPEWAMELFIHATRLAGCRAIIQTSCSERYPAESQQDNVFFIGRHPHQPLFKHCLAVVHHGGAGTTHSATLSGCASIVIPFMDEQLFWGCQLQKVGIAPAPLPARKATAEKLAERLRIVMQSTTIKERAQEAKQRMSATQGVERAVALIESLGSGLNLLP